MNHTTTLDSTTSTSSDWFSASLHLIIPSIYISLGLYTSLRIQYLRTLLLLREIHQIFYGCFIGLFYLPLAMLAFFYSHTNSDSHLMEGAANPQKFMMFVTFLLLSFLYTLINQTPKRTPDDTSVESAPYNDSERNYQKNSFIGLAVLYALLSTLYRYEHLKMVASGVSVLVGVVSVVMAYRVLDSVEIYQKPAEMVTRLEVLEEFRLVKKKIFGRFLIGLSLAVATWLSLMGLQSASYEFKVALLVSHLFIGLTCHCFFVLVFYNFYYQKDVLDRRISKMKGMFHFHTILTFPSFIHSLPVATHLL